MKTGILTFHFARNYGAVLQCFALQEYLSSLGQEVYVIDYRPKSIASGYRLFDIRRFWGRTPAKFLRRTSRELSVFRSRAARYRAFEDFVRKHFKFIGVGECDMIIVGSDQVWNPALTAGVMDPYYWGEALSGTRLVSYAASIENGASLLNDKDLRTALARFEGVSLREREMLKRIMPIRSDAQLCCDPVLLLTAPFWKRLAGSSKLVPERPYLLYYQVRSSQEGLAMARAEAQRRQLKLICLSAKPEDENTAETACSSPEDFLALVNGAEFVLTTSFHGCVFSVLLHKEFLAISLGDGRDGRIADLLDKLKLSSRLSGASVCRELSPIDWEEVDRAVESIRSSSESYLAKYSI